MFEKVNPSHPDKIADRIAGAIVDYAYTQSSNPKIAVEVLIGHGHATVIVESSVFISKYQVRKIVKRIANISNVKYIWSSQDVHLAMNQSGHYRCGDNGIFRGVPMTVEEKELTAIAKTIYHLWPYDGKYIIDNADEGRLVICQSNVRSIYLKCEWPFAEVNPLGDWTGGTDVDSGATNRKIGSDMGQSITGGGLHGKDLSKADVSLNIYAWIKAQKLGKPVELTCAIGQEAVDGRTMNEIVDIARKYIAACGGFEQFAKWGLIGGPEPSKLFDLIK